MGSQHAVSTTERHSLTADSSHARSLHTKVEGRTSDKGDKGLQGRGVRGGCPSWVVRRSSAAHTTSGDVSGVTQVAAVFVPASARARGNCGAWPNKKKYSKGVDALLGMRGNGYCQSLITETLGPTVHAYLKQSGELNSVVSL